MWMMIRLFVGFLLMVFGIGTAFIDTSKKEYWIGAILLIMVSVLILMHAGKYPV